ncbi:hypothetical protein Cgig2_022289 [Carnegiea gigantea]|uniref:FHA domain-containing protein n=1 Tax=Carnegiea gigantea TaxID=171969 RepID=A0A9Q1KHG4_9CARY|nr:hypothetical protein Cgig2_022289 [Carnegiea gigantea]
MEIEGSDGSKTLLKPCSTTVFGRGKGFHPNDLAVSRRHISFEFTPSTDPPDSQTGPRVSFEVLGKNPVWVYSKNEGGKIRTFKKFQRGQLRIGDMFCLSAKDPVWFTVKEVEKEVVDERESKRGEIEDRVSNELSQSLEISYGVNERNGDSGLDAVDVSSIDPVQEFGFLVIGHEFDQYPRKKIRDVENWDWFLEDPRGDSDEEEEVVEKRERGGRRGKRKKTKGDDDVDEEWTAESEDEEVVTTNARKVQRPTYQTRSKDQGKPSRNRKSNIKASTKKEGEEECKEDEEDETLGGFIVEDDTVEEREEEEDDDGDDEEEEFVEDEDEDDLED